MLQIPKKSTKVPLNFLRSKAEVAEKVAIRVKQRDQFQVNGQFPVSSHKSFWTEGLPEYLRFRVPPKALLDKEFPVHPLDWAALSKQSLDTENAAITWLGHASLLVQQDGLNILTDPIFSERCSPSQWIGPKRYRRAPCDLHEMLNKLEIHVVLISHNHYDHLDFTTVKEIQKFSPTTLFVVPLGLQSWFRVNISDTMDIMELDWFESGTLSDSVDIVSLPMRHWSNRVGDRDETLWCGYSVAGKKHKFLFPGDTAYFDELENLGEQYGPWTYGAIPIGAYAPRDFMRDNHINVHEALLFKDSMQINTAFPIHWGTFALTTEPVMEPRDKLVELMSIRPDKDSFQPWCIGDTFTVIGSS